MSPEHTITRVRLSKAKQLVYPPVGLCIYCGKRDGGLTREHVIPIGLGGGFVLRQASCEDCRKVTHGFETTCLRRMFLNYRLRTGLVRKKTDIPASVPLAIDFEPPAAPRSLPPEQHPPAFLVPQVHGHPGILCGGVPNMPVKYTYQIFGDEDELHRLLAQHTGKVITVRVMFDDFAFFRMLAKIAHSFAVGEFGIESFDPELPDLILGRTPGLVSYLIGESVDKIIPVHSKQATHQLDSRIASIGGRVFVIIRVCLFAAVGAPAYDVVAGHIIPTKRLLRKLGLVSATPNRVKGLPRMYGKSPFDAH